VLVHIWPSNNRPVHSLIILLHCHQLIFRKISKTGATRCQILRLKYSNFVFRPRPCWGSLRHSTDPGLYSSGLRLRGGKERGEEENRERVKMEVRGGEERGKREKGKG